MKRVLVIEPDRSTRNKVQAKLERHGFEIDPVPSYDDALLALSFTHIDLLVFGRSIPDEEKVQMAIELQDDGIEAPIISLRAEGGAERLHPQIAADLPEAVRHQELGARAISLTRVSRAA